MSTRYQEEMCNRLMRKLGSQPGNPAQWRRFRDDEVTSEGGGECVVRNIGMKFWGSNKRGGRDGADHAKDIMETQKKFSMSRRRKKCPALGKGERGTRPA